MPPFPGRADGERFAAKQSLSTSGVFFLPRQVIRCPHLRDNEATVRPIVNTLHGLLNGPPNQPQPPPAPFPWYEVQQCADGLAMQEFVALYHCYATLRCVFSCFSSGGQPKSL